MEIQVGKQSLQFAEAPYVISSASIVGKKEGEGPLGSCFDVVGEDDKFGQNTWEEAESTLQKEAFTMAVGKAGLKPEDIRYLFSGDLLGRTLRPLLDCGRGVPFVWTIRSVQHLRGGAVPWGDVRGSRLCGLCCVDDIEPFRKCGKAVPFSIRVCEPETEVSNLDRDGQWCVCAR